MKVSRGDFVTVDDRFSSFVSGPQGAFKRPNLGFPRLVWGPTITVKSWVWQVQSNAVVRQHFYRQQRSCGQGYVFTRVLILSTGAVSSRETPPEGRTPWQGEPQQGEPPWQGESPGKEIPLARKPPGKETPLQGEPTHQPPLWQLGPPGKETP